MITSQKDHKKGKRFDVLKLIDFGFAEFISTPRTSEGFIRRRDFRGTLLFMAPEMFRVVGYNENNNFDLFFDVCISNFKIAF